MKIAQLLSTVPDLLPEEYVKELTKLQSNAPPMGWNFVKRRMKNELGFNWLGFHSILLKNNLLQLHL